MRILHVSDTHLGFSEYSRIDPESGINQREKDFYDAWWHVIDGILAEKPDLVVHAGDLFHTPRPSNRAIAVAMEGIQRVSEAGIPWVLISGNHSTPRIRTTGSIFESITLFPNVFAAYQGVYERFRVGDCDVHCIPHCALSEDLEAAIQSIRFEGASCNLLVAHGAWQKGGSYTMGEFNEQILIDPELVLGIRFDYIALGHYHRQIDLHDHASYSGSTERTSFNEAGYTSGYLLVDLESGEREYRQIPSRPMVKLGPVDCAGSSAAEIYAELENLSTPALNDALVSLALVNIAHDTFLKLDSRAIDEIFSQVFYLEKQFSQIARPGESAAGTAIASLPVEFERYIENMPEGEFDRERLKALGVRYLQEDEV
jgi:DNA repair exonuclease SbcCD nuclease subunit